MKRILRCVVGFATLAFLVAGCKDKATDPLWVTNRYLAALERKDYHEAYRYLYERGLVVKTSDGKELLFPAKPSLEVFKRSYSKVIGIKVLGIESKPDLSIEGKLEVFYAIARIQEEAKAEESKFEGIEVFLAPDDKGRWWVLVSPPLMVRAAPKLADSLRVAP